MDELKSVGQISAVTYPIASDFKRQFCNERHNLVGFSAVLMIKSSAITPKPDGRGLALRLLEPKKCSDSVA
jgi:hypothetical protein